MHVKFSDLSHEHSSVSTTVYISQCIVAYTKERQYSSRNIRDNTPQSALLNKAYSHIWPCAHLFFHGVVCLTACLHRIGIRLCVFVAYYNGQNAIIYANKTQTTTKQVNSRQICVGFQFFIAVTHKIESKSNTYIYRSYPTFRCLIK
jgi:hypothetical protein